MRAKVELKALIMTAKTQKNTYCPRIIRRLATASPDPATAEKNTLLRTMTRTFIDNSCFKFTTVIWNLIFQIHGR